MQVSDFYEVYINNNEISMQCSREDFLLGY